MVETYESLDYGYVLDRGCTTLFRSILQLLRVDFFNRQISNVKAGSLHRPKKDNFWQWDESICHDIR